MVQLRDIITALQEINTAHIDESAMNEPAFRKWWKVSSHEFPECLKSFLATGFVAGYRMRVSLDSIQSDLKTELIDALETVFERLKKDD